jgi:hypothetical protein
LGPEGGRPGRPTCSENLGIVKILRYIRSDIKLHHISKNPSYEKKLAGRWAPWPTGPCAEAHLSTMVNPALFLMHHVYTVFIE